MLNARLGLKSRKTLVNRVKALKRAKAISLVVEHASFTSQFSTWELLVSPRLAATAKYGRFMPSPLDVAELLADPANRQKQLDRIRAENGSLPDWRTHEDAKDAEDADAEDAADDGSDEVV